MSDDGDEETDSCCPWPPVAQMEVRSLMLEEDGGARAIDIEWDVSRAEADAEVEEEEQAPPEELLSCWFRPLEVRLEVEEAHESELRSGMEITAPVDCIIDLMLQLARPAMNA